MTFILNVTPAEFHEIHEKLMTLPDALFATWARDRFKLPDTLFETVHLHVTDPSESQ